MSRFQHPTRAIFVPACRPQARFWILKFGISLVLGAWCLGFPVPLSAQTTNINSAPRRPPVANLTANPPGKPSRPDFAAFKIITERNIFNPHRFGTTSVRPVSPRSFVRTDSFALVGTMIYAKGPHAFFEGSGSEYTKVAKPSDTIAGYVVSDIQPGGVTLTAGTNVVELPVGMQMSRKEGGVWLRSARPEPVYVSRGERSSEFQRGVGQPNATTIVVPTASEAGAPDAQGPVIMVNGEAITLPFSTEGLPPGIVAPNVQFLTVPPATGPIANPAAVPANGSADDVLARLRARAAAERGDPP